MRPFVPEWSGEWLLTSLATLVAGSVILGYVSRSLPTQSARTRHLLCPVIGVLSVLSATLLCLQCSGRER